MKSLYNKVLLVELFIEYWINLNKYKFQLITVDCNYLETIELIIETNDFLLQYLCTIELQFQGKFQMKLFFCFAKL